MGGRALFRPLFFALVATAGAAPPRRAAPPAGGALAVDFESTHKDPLNSDLTRRTAEAVARAGVKWARVFVEWNKVELAVGTYSFQGTDNLMARLGSLGFSVFVTLNGGGGVGGNPIYAGGASPTAANRALGPWLDFVQRAVERYQGSVAHWEIWNEPNLDWKPAPNAADYGALARETALRIRSVQPGAYVVLGGTSLVDLRFTESILPLAGRHVDAVGIHPYRQYPEQSQDAWLARYPGLTPNAGFTATGAASYAGEIVKLRDLFSRSGFSGLQVWSTEAGYPSRTEGEGVFSGGEVRQAKCLARYFLLNLGLGVERISWFRALDPNYQLNLFTPPDQPWVEGDADPVYLAAGRAATFAPLTLSPLSSLVVPATSYAQGRGLRVAGAAVSPADADNFAEYHIPVPVAADYTIWFRLKGPAPSDLGAVLCGVNGSTFTRAGGADYGHVSVNAGAVAQGSADFSRFYHSPVFYSGPLEQYHPAIFALSGALRLRIQILQGALDQVRLVRLGEVTAKKSLTALRTLTALFDGKAIRSNVYLPVFSGGTLTAEEWAQFQTATFLRPDGAPLVAYWVGVEPQDEAFERTVTVSLPAGLEAPVLIDPLEGTSGSLGGVASARVFSLPVKDYPLILSGGVAAPDAVSSGAQKARVFPNPFRPALGHAEMRFTGLPAGEFLRIYTASGQLVKELFLEAPGEARWDGSTRQGSLASSGVYLAKARNGRILKLTIQR